MDTDKTPLSAEDLWSCITFFRPTRPVLVTTRNRDGTVHVAPFAWCAPISAMPPMVSLALLTTPRKQHSLVNIEREKQFVVNLPGHDLSADLVRASYRYPAGVYKRGVLGFEYSPSQRLDVLSIKRCRAFLECRLNTSHLTGDHTLLVADVVAASYAPERYQEGFIPDVEAYPPCLHLGQISSPEGQLHSFMVDGRIEALDVPFNLPCPVPGPGASAKTAAPPDVEGEDIGGKNQWKANAAVFATGFACPEGPCSNGGQGDLFVVDWAVGTVRRVTPEGEVTDFADTGGMPAGACLGADGHLAVCDTGRKAVLDVSPEGAVTVTADGHQGNLFLGPNGCAFDAKGNLYFSDANGFHPVDPSGRVYLLRPDGTTEIFAEGLAFPTKLCISADGECLYLAETFASRIHRFTLDERGHARSQEIFADLCGGIGPVGLALDVEGNLYAAHFGKGVVAVLDPAGSLLAELPTGGLLPTNLAFWNGSLYVTELEAGCVMCLDVDRCGGKGPVADSVWDLK